MADYDYKCIPFLYGALAIGDAKKLGDISTEITRKLESVINKNADGGWEFYGLYEFEGFFAVVTFRRPK